MWHIALVLEKTPQDLTGNYSKILNVAQLAVINFLAPSGSSEINSSLYLNVHQYANKMLSKKSDIADAVMLHRTNTLGEMASSLFVRHEEHNRVKN